MISIIIPVYNTERWIGSCLDSVLCSSYPDFEVILVNDGSEDNSLQICRRYSMRDCRIKLLDQDHQGVSAARNVGLKACKGQWIVFVDSDDAISGDFMEAIAELEYQKHDLLLFDHARLSGKADKKKLERTTGPNTKGYLFKVNDRVVLIDKLLSASQIVEGGNLSLLSPCAKAYKKSVIERYSIRFPEDIFIGEDRLFNIEYLQHVQSCTYISKNVYYVRSRIDSTMRSFNLYYLQNDIKYQEKLEFILKKHKVFSEVKRSYYDSVLSNMADILIRGIFNPHSSRNYRAKCKLCHEMQGYIIYKRALKHNKETGIIPRRILLFFFQREWYGLVNLICGLCYVILETTGRL